MEIQVTPEITLTVTHAGTYTPEDAQSSRYPGTWDRTRWECVARENGQEQLRDIIETPAHGTAADAADAFTSFVTAAGEQYECVMRKGILDSGIDDWVFGTRDAGEFCYLHDDEFWAIRQYAE